MSVCSKDQIFSKNSKHFEGNKEDTSYNAVHLYDFIIQINKYKTNRNSRLSDWTFASHPFGLAHMNGANH